MNSNTQIFVRIAKVAKIGKATKHNKEHTDIPKLTNLELTKQHSKPRNNTPGDLENNKQNINSNTQIFHRIAKVAKIGKATKTQ